MMRSAGWMKLGQALWLASLAGCLPGGTRAGPGPHVEPGPSAEAVRIDRPDLGTAPATPYQPIAVAAVRPATPPAATEPTATERQDRYPATEAKAPTVVPPPEAAPPPAIVQALALLLAHRTQGNADAEAVALLQQYAPANQEMLLQLLPLIARLTEGGLDQAEARELAHVIDVLEGVAAPLRRRAPLTIERACACRQPIRKFGEFAPHDERKSFRPGELVQLYIEVRNVVSEPADCGYEVRLATRLEIRDESGKVVWRLDSPDHGRPERSLTPPRDFFTSPLFSLPETFAPGQYQLHITLTDLNTREREPARASLPLEVTHRP